MAKTLLIGGSSAIASALKENSDREFISLSRSEGTLDLDNDLNELDSVADINGLVYFPGTINLKPFAMLKEEDFVNDFSVNVLGAVKVLKENHQPIKRSRWCQCSLYLLSAANLGLPYHASISASKSALEGMSKALAQNMQQQKYALM